MSAPVLVEVFRGQQLESRHRGSLVVLDYLGREKLSIGDCQSPVFARSALKPIQVLPLLEQMSDQPLAPQRVALACASHNGEDIHVQAVQQWLSELSLDPEDLACGASLPMYTASAHALLKRGEGPSRAHHNCSGKHSGLLQLCRLLDSPIRDYQDYQHPSQQHWLQTLGDLTQLEAQKLPWGYDGCGIPAVALPLPSLAFAFAQLADPSRQAPNRQQAMQHVVEALQTHPFMVAGSERCCTRVMQVTQGRVLVKTGAEGVFAGCIPSLGLGFALKAEDGNTRASETLLGALLQHLGQIDETQAQALSAFFARPILNSRGQPVGQIRARPLVA